MNKAMAHVQLKSTNALFRRFTWEWRTVVSIFSINVKNGVRHFVGRNLKLERPSSKRKSLPQPADIFPRRAINKS
jgi:hypothetical protein